MPNPLNGGFQPMTRMGGAPFSVRMYAKPASDATQIVYFDMVMKAPASVPLDERPDYSYPACQSANKGTPGTSLWLGAAMKTGFASKQTLHPVADQIDCIFFCNIGQAPGRKMTTTEIAGKNCNITNNLGGTNLNRSFMGANCNTVDVTETLDLRIQRCGMISPNAEPFVPGVLPPQFGNVGQPLVSGARSVCFEVTINKHFFGQATPGA